MRAYLVGAWFALGMGCSPTVLVAKTERDPFVDLDQVVPRDQLTISLVVLAPSEPERLLLSDEPLHNGGRIALKVRTSHDAYVNVVLFSSSGQVKVLFPHGDYNQISGQCPVRIPRLDWLTVQGPAGAENLHVIASTIPLAQADPVLCRRLRLPCSSAVEPARPLPCTVQPAPPQKGQRDISPLLKWAKDNGAGVADLRVTLQHVP